MDEHTSAHLPDPGAYIANPCPHCGAKTRVVRNGATFWLDGKRARVEADIIGCTECPYMGIVGYNMAKLRDELEAVVGPNPDINPGVDGLVRPCAVCGRSVPFDFNLTDDAWRALAPPDHRTDVICLPCLDEVKHGVPLDSLRVVYWTGRQGTVALVPVHVRWGRRRQGLMADLDRQGLKLGRTAAMKRRVQGRRDRSKSIALVLEAVRQEPGATTSDIAELTGYSMGWTSNLVREAEALGLLEREPEYAPQGGSRIRHRLSREGELVLYEAPDGDDGAWPRVLRRIANAEGRTD